MIFCCCYCIRTLFFCCVFYRSTAITKQTLEIRFPDLFLLDSLENSKTKTLEDFTSSKPDEVAKVQKAVDETTEFMAQFRADNIVFDAEDIKDALMKPTEEIVTVRTPKFWRLPFLVSVFRLQLDTIFIVLT